VTALNDAASDAPLDHARLDPARIATVMGPSRKSARGQARTIAAAAGCRLQAVKTATQASSRHRISAILRAAFADLSAGHVVQAAVR